MSDDIAIKVENLTKIYKLYNSPMDRLKEALSPIRRKYHHDFHALNDVSFEVKKGETVGIIGKNGSGKSTLLKLITGVLTPTSGTVQVNGRISALLELGSGFNPELTGIENVYFNGTLMGYNKEEMDNRLDDILGFADIGEFVKQPVKTYSSGMFVRLAFAVAVNVNPEILIVDEALAVGDLRFQKKCKMKMNEFRDNKISQVIVSHNMADITTGCKRALYLNNGNLLYFDDAFEAVATYIGEENSLIGKNIVNDQSQCEGTGDLVVHEVACYQSDKLKGCSQIQYGKNIIVEIKYEVFQPIVRPVLRVNFSATAYRFFVNFDFKLEDNEFQKLKEHGNIRVEILSPNIYPGSYMANISFQSEEMNTHLFRWSNAYAFNIIPPEGIYMQSPYALIHLDARLLEIK